MTETILDLDTHIFHQLLEVLILQPLGTHKRRFLFGGSPRIKKTTRRGTPTG
jgi:hypothetical protein